ncbi:MAG: TatD family hydrolase [Muribaculaceae bacterium]|nr:TatD family hydrolase [Muribaculaceae bacterium]
MTDTHTHLYTIGFPDEARATVRRAVEAGVVRMVFPGIDPESAPALLALAREWPDNVRIALGLHPTELGFDWRGRLAEMERMYAESGLPVAAIGEVGIDLHWEQETIPEQIEAFSRQLDMALERDIPVIIHSRDALDRTISCIKECVLRHDGRLPKLIFHSFTGSRDDVRRIREVCDPMFGINGVVTYKNAPLLREALPEIGIDRLLLETDSPYLSPVPFRGRRNESAYLPHILGAVSTALGLPEEEVEKATDRNAALLFGFPLP